MKEERLYFFQFPTPFPKFTSKMTSAMDVDPVPELGGKKVSFASDVKPDGIELPKTNAGGPQKIEPVDGVVGQLEVYKSGAVKIRLANDILLDVGVFISFVIFALKHV
jgi:DNA-directed RNA polymerase III subunit RPC4